VLADLDHDGDLDLVTWSYGDPVRIWKNDGHGQFLPAATLPAPTPSLTGQPVLGDFNGDGDLDVAVSTLFLNDGQLTFTGSASLGIPRVAFDVDGDGDLDLITSPTEQTWAVLKNDGKGHFTQTQMTQEFLTDAEVGDFDNDGDLDVVALTSLGQQRAVILLNDGTGTFEERDAGLLVNASRGLSVGDVDDDGDLDVFIGNWGQAGGFNPNDQVWLNDGAAHFSAGDAPLSGSVQIVLADVDGDGDLDAVAGQHVPYTSEKGQPSLVLLNDGTGHFSSSGQVGGSNFQNIALGDLDGDGDLDAVVAQWDWTLKPPVQIWLQSG